MLLIEARDGAGRAGTAAIDERALEIPTILWLEEELGPEETHFEPLLGTRPDPRTLVVATKSFEAPVPAINEGQVLLQRTLDASPQMMSGAVQLRDLGKHLTVLPAALSLSQNPRRFAPLLAQARVQAGYGNLLYAPGLGEPAHVAVLCYAGIDLFDSVPLSLAAAEGRYLTAHGAFPASTLARGECSCPACRDEAPEAFSEPELRRHNHYAARSELGAVRNAIRGGRLRELVEARVRAHPELTALLRRIDQQYSYLEERTPIVRRTRLFANTKESLRRADVRRFRDRIENRYVPASTAPVLLLLPCSHRKPYSRSRTHRAFADAIERARAASLTHEMIVTSPLGLVPRELENTYPAAHYDVPVTGEWDEEEGTMIRGLIRAVLARHPYPKVVSHLPRHTHELVASVLPADTIVTCRGDDATKSHELSLLTSTLSQCAGEFRTRARPKLMRERIQGLAAYQFGAEAAQVLMEGADAHGRWPTIKVHAAGQQLGMVPPERGLLSLTLEGGRRIASAGVYRVEIEDFRVTGSVFAVGIRDADPQIRVGDEVVVVHGGDVRAVGVAAMTGPEMVELERGEAVKVRHHA